jgi:hypothetical protein
MSRFQIGDTVALEGQPGRIVWLRENANEIEAMDEYIVEFKDKHRQFVVSGELQAKPAESVHDRVRNRDPRQRQTH